jgi:PEP-CTERM motif
MRVLTKFSLGLIVLLASIAFAPAIKADLIVIRTGGFSLTNLGNNGGGIKGLDALIGAASTTTRNINGNGKFFALLNPLTFRTGFTGIGSGGFHDFNFSQDLTINGVTQTLSMAGQIHISQFVDTVRIISAAPLIYTFNTFSVTVNLIPATIVGNGSGEFCDVLKAEVTVTKAYNPVPEPATLSLLGLGLAGAAATLRKRRKARSV